ncbi:TPA: hypothetical protein QDB13_000060 [Burkholderia vietnamiensis]|nr:hypothetical protein [Burkholderia vietnamiensis]
MARFHCRCRNCETRRVLKKRPDEYVRQPQCDVCGRRDFRIDSWMQKRNTRLMACTCAGYWFWHRRGSLYCWHRADGSIRSPGDPDFADRNPPPDALAA